MERFEVPDYDDPDRNYLTRWRIVQTPWFGVYLHRMDGPDPRPTLHDHPWNFTSIILRGGYTEATSYRPFDVLVGPAWGHVHGSWETHRRGRLNRKAATDAHTITCLVRIPTWTLVFVGRRRRVWGYIDPDGTWTAFDEHRHAAEFETALAVRAARADARA
jgi:hypothetical protein